MASQSVEDLFADDGYDSDYFLEEEAARLYKCPICTCICRDPVETEPCGHLYCKRCLESYLQCSLADWNNNSNQVRDLCSKDRTCANCRKEIESSTRSQWVRRQVNNLKVRCANHAMGCNWKSTLNYLRSHVESGCLYMSEVCPHCQETSFLRKDKESHFAKCPDVCVKCDLCDMGMKRKELKSHFESECDMKEVECPQHCAQKKIVLKYLDKHVEKECINTVVECPYSRYGCRMSLMRKKIRSHVVAYQVLHLEMKVMYLQRLAESPELLNLVNTTGVNPEMNGLYYREKNPFNGFACYRHDRNKTFVIRFDSKLPGWVLDTNSFDGNIVASRRGYFVAPQSNCKMEESSDDVAMYDALFSDLECGMFDNLNDNASDDNDSIVQVRENETVEPEHPEPELRSSDMELDEKQPILYPTPADTQIIEKMEKPQIPAESEENELNQNKNEKKEKKEMKKNAKMGKIYNDGIWHMMNADAKKSAFLLQAYSRKEWDLEWKLKIMQASSAKSTPGNGSKCEVVVCLKCNRQLEETTVSQAHGKGVSVSCNSCDRELKNAIFHCPGGSGISHLNGFDLCLECGTARLKTQKLKSVTCTCGKTMVAIFAKNGYSFTSKVMCNNCGCGLEGEDVMWHCQKKHCAKHRQGYDLCLQCGSKVKPPPFFDLQSLWK